MLKRSRQPEGSVVPFEPRKSSFPWAEMAEALPVALLITTAERVMKIELMMMMMSQTIMREELSLLQDLRASRRELQSNLVLEGQNGDMWGEKTLQQIVEM